MHPRASTACSCACELLSGVASYVIVRPCGRVTLTMSVDCIYASNNDESNVKCDTELEKRNRQLAHRQQGHVNGKAPRAR